jgi:class 3 adenylate cyclase
MATWENIHDGERIELGIVQVDIAGHSKLGGSDRALHNAKSIFREQMEGIARSRNGRLFNWAGDGGAFMFLTGSGEGFDDLVFSAIQMLTNLPAINEEIAIRTDLNTQLDVRISCDCDIATYDSDPGEITADFINRFFKHERTIGLTNTVSITERVSMSQ